MDVRGAHMSGQRFQINEIDFQVVAAHPPAGYVTDATKVTHLTDHAFIVQHVPVSVYWS